MKKATGLALSLMAALAVAGCSETKMQDLLGSGKDATPDESQVRVNRNLSMPPDLNLPAPSGEVAEDGVPNKVVAATPPAQPVADQAQPAPVQTASATPPAISFPRGICCLRLPGRYFATRWTSTRAPGRVAEAGRCPWP